MLASKALCCCQIARALPKRVPLPPAGRPRDGDRMGEEPAAHARRRTRRALGDHEPPIPADLMAARLSAATRSARPTGASSTSRTCSSCAIRLYDEDAAALDRLPGALPRVHGRRVPGRQPPPADAARPLARRPRRALRRRRRLPVDLRLHGRDARATCSACPSASRRRRGPARGELPLDAAGARRSRTGSCRSWAASQKVLRATPATARSRWRCVQPTG